MALSALQRAYNSLRKRKSAYCKGKVNKQMVKLAANTYIKKAMAKGQTKSEATKKANAILNAGCKMSSRVSGTKKRKTRRRRRK